MNRMLDMPLRAPASEQPQSLEKLLVQKRAAQKAYLMKMAEDAKSAGGDGNHEQDRVADPLTEPEVEHVQAQAVALPETTPEVVNTEIELAEVIWDDLLGHIDDAYTKMTNHRGNGKETGRESEIEAQLMLLFRNLLDVYSSKSKMAVRNRMFSDARTLQKHILNTIHMIPPELKQEWEAIEEILART